MNSPKKFLIILSLIIVSLIFYIKLPKESVVKTEDPKSIPVYTYLFFSPIKLSDPIIELNQLVSTLSAQSSQLLQNGDLIIGGEADSKINFVFSQKPQTPLLQTAYRLIDKINLNYQVKQIFFVNNNLYLDLSGFPQVILSLNTPEEKLQKLIESIPTLAKIKMSAKIIDLRFNNPIIR